MPPRYCWPVRWVAGLFRRSITFPLLILLQSATISKFSAPGNFMSFPACIAAVYMWYNYIRFGNILEFGHNYLPEFMRMPAGQFGWEYFWDNFLNVFADFPKWTAEGLQFNNFGFCFYVANPIFLLLILAGIYYCCAPAYRPLLSRQQSNRKTMKKNTLSPVSARLQDTQIPEVLLLSAMLTVHLFHCCFTRRWAAGSSAPDIQWT